jgi:hypothetical protein
MRACDRAIQSITTSQEYYKGRGLARTLRGDFGGAIEDLKIYLGWLGQIDDPAIHSGWSSWVEALEAGQNPFDEELLSQLQAPPSFALIPPGTDSSPANTQTSQTPSLLPAPVSAWNASPNFNNRRRPDDITMIVMHASANSSQQTAIDWYNNPASQTSMHYTIGKDGTIVQHVQDTDRAWHAGRSVWKDREGGNDFSIGIEFINLNDGQDPYPTAQHQAAVHLVAYLAQKYNIKVEDIVAHYDIALPAGRKTDPRGYNMDRLRRDVAALLEAK